MCGIAGYIGKENAPEILFDMLKRLEYRGYDSAGIACISNNILYISKDKGKVSEIEEKVNLSNIDSKIGIAHTRWATHGEPSHINSHPHTDCKEKFCVVHNGIIENYKDLRDELIMKGHRFTSETDTEVIPHLIEELFDGDFETAFVDTINKLRGSFAIAVISLLDADKIFVARKESPLIIGIGNGENLIASDTPALIHKTRDVIILDDFNYGIVGSDYIIIKDLNSRKEIKKEIHHIEWDVKQAEKEGYKHFMLKEIFEEPFAVKNALKAQEDIKKIAKRISKLDRIYFVACGTAFYASLVAKYLLERFGIASDAILGSEFRYSTVNTVNKNCAIIAVSQSGETADTLVSARESKNKGAYVAGIVNVVGSSLTRIVDDNIYIYAGPEIAVASTKAYIGQITSLTLLSLFLAKEKGRINEEYLMDILDNMYSIPDKITQVLNNNKEIMELAEKFCKKEIFFYIGRRQNLPTALEGALKIKEISYVHAEAYPAGEMKHGPLALLERGVPVIAIMPNDELLEKMENNISEARARNAIVLKVSENGEFRVPAVDPLLSPIVYITPLHLFAYYISINRGLDPDKPRNLAKSVTVE